MTRGEAIWVNVLGVLMGWKYCSYIKGVGRRWSECKVVETEILDIVE